MIVYNIYKIYNMLKLLGLICLIVFVNALRIQESHVFSPKTSIGLAKSIKEKL